MAESVPRGLLLMVALLSAGSAAAQRHQLVSDLGIRTGIIFTDNLFSTAQDKKSAAILQLTPYVTGEGKSARNSYQYFYGPSGVFYGGGYSDLNRVAHFLQARATLVLIDEYLSLNFSANANQNLIISDGLGSRGGFDSLGDPEAYAQTASAQVTPVFSLPLIRGEYATVQIAPGINYTFTTDTANGESNVGQSGTRTNVSVVSGEYFSRVSWRLNWYINGLFGDSGGDSNRYSGATFDANYRWSRELSVQATVGYDGNSYASDDDNTDTTGLRWRITPFWTPTSRTTIGLGYGQRYFGNDWYLSWNHRFKRSVLNLSYETVVTDARTAILDQQVVSFEDPFGDAVDPADSQDFTGTYTTPSLTNDTFIQSQLLGSFAWRHGRNGVSVSLSQNERKYQNAPTQYLDRFSTWVYSRRLTPRASSSLRLTYWQHDDQTESAAQDNDFTQYRASLVWGYKISKRLNTNVVYSFINRTSAVDSYDYNENRLYLTLNWHL